MEDATILGIIALLAAIALLMSFMRLWFVTNYDADLGNKVKGLRMSFAKLSKDLKAQYEESSNDLHNTEARDVEPDMSIIDLKGLDDMTLEQAAESIGIDPEHLTNPLVRPLAEKIFEGIKKKAKGEQDGGQDKIFR